MNLTANSKLKTCRRILTQISQAKKAILADARHRFVGPERLLELAVNEAEALSWQTRFPHLLFPTLAAEKVAAIGAWAAHQRWVRETNSERRGA